jgi:hypothetical protein
MNIIQLYADYNIPFQTEGNKHCRPGWVQINCPFCEGESNMHLGCNIDSGYFSCWRCGWKSTEKVIAKLLGIKESETKQILRKYQIGTFKIYKESNVKIRLKSHRFPSGTELMTERHKKYLEGRRFDSERLEHDWGLLGTGVVAKLDNIDFKHRIIVPIDWNNTQVSFQARDITNKSKLKYITCPKNRELVFHKNILFGKQEHWNNTGICVEGVFDVFRFGFNSFATFGIEYTAKQIRLIAKTFKRVAIIFDGGESQALLQAQKLVSELKFRGVVAWNVKIEGDPGGMNQDDANYLIKTIIK